MSVQAPPTTAPILLPDILWERFFKALHIKRRLYVIREFAEELDRVRRGKPYRRRNDIVWYAMLDVRDKLVIDLYSLTVEMRHGIEPKVDATKKKPQKQRHGNQPAKKKRWTTKKRGLFIEIRDHHCTGLTRTYVPHPDDDDYEIEMHTEGRAKCFERLFPGCNTESPSPADVEGLCDEFRKRMSELGKDRNKNRAHALEGDAGTVKMLWVPELTELFEYVEGLLEDLSLVSGGSAFVSDNMNEADCKQTAEDTVDLVLLGNISDVRRFTATRTRDELYARLHEIHDNSGDTRELYFNDRQFGPPFEDWPVTLV